MSCAAWRVLSPIYIAPAFGAQPGIDVSQRTSTGRPFVKAAATLHVPNVGPRRRFGATVTSIYASRGRQDISTTLVDHTIESVRRLNTNVAAANLPSVPASGNVYLPSVPRVPARQPGRWLLDEGLCLYGTDLGLLEPLEVTLQVGGGR